jgi:predicted nucleic acid-binding protein
LIHLDTGFLIRALARNSQEDRRFRAWLKGAEPLGMSAISWTEFLCGPVGAEDIELASRILREPVAFNSDDAALTSRLFNQGGRRRGSLTDCMIAASAIRAGAALATTNPADFRRFEPAGLTLAA